MILLALKEQGFPTIDMGIVKDNPVKLKEMLQKASREGMIFLHILSLTCRSERICNVIFSNSQLMLSLHPVVFLWVSVIS